MVESATVAVYLQASMHVHDLMPLRNININLTHTVNHLSFGTDYPGMKNPLDKWQQVQAVPTCMYQYFLKVVPTLYEYVTGDKDKVESNQYSVTGGCGGSRFALPEAADHARDARVSAADLPCFERLA